MIVELGKKKIKKMIKAHARQLLRRRLAQVPIGVTFIKQKLLFPKTFNSQHCSFHLNHHQWEQTQRDYDDKIDEQVLLAKQSMELMQFLSLGTSLEHPRDMMIAPLISLHVPFYRFFFDGTFDENEFLEGCKMAFTAVRQMLIDADWASLKQVLTPDAFEDVKAWYNSHTDIKPSSSSDSEEHTKETQEARKYYLRGSVHRIREARIRRIKIYFVDESFKKIQTDIVVGLNLKEDLSVVDEHGMYIHGTKGPLDHVALLTFRRGSPEDPWKVKCFFG
jgi:hypothetical protein